MGHCTVDYGDIEREDVVQSPSTTMDIQECLQFCRNHAEATGCMYLTDRGYTSCYATTYLGQYTGTNGDDAFKCLVFE